MYFVKHDESTVHVRTRTSDKVDTRLLRSLDEGLDVSEPGKVDPSPALRLVQTPKGVERDGVEAGGLDLLEDVEVERVHRHPALMLVESIGREGTLVDEPVGMEFTAEDQGAFAVDHEGVLIPCYLFNS